MIETALKGLGYGDAEVSVVVTDNVGIRKLNRKYRKMDRATDVLSFPLNDPYMLGDIVISADKVSSQAEEFMVTEDEELGRLLVHGLLHLLGYDHVIGGRQAREMKEKEEELMGLLKRKGLFKKVK